MSDRKNIRRVVEEYLKTQLNSKELAITVFLGYKSNYTAEILNTVYQLSEIYNTSFVLTEEWLREVKFLKNKTYLLIEEATQQDFVSITDKTSAFVIPSATYGMLTKLALTIDDEPVIRLAIQFQLQGKPIVIAKDEVDLNVNQQIQAPQNLQARLQSYVKKIQAEQIYWVPLSRVLETVGTEIKAYKERKFLVLKKHIDKAFQEGLEVVNIPDKSRISPLAKEKAVELNIKISNKS